jgi:aconitate hydratase
MIERDGQIGAFEAVDGVALANACGPYIGFSRRNIQETLPEAAEVSGRHLR